MCCRMSDRTGAYACRRRLTRMIFRTLSGPSRTPDKPFPRGGQPAFALSEGYLVIAGSPGAVRRFRKGAGAASPATEALCLRISVTHVSKLIAQHRATLAAFLAEKNQIK